MTLTFADAHHTELVKHQLIEKDVKNIDGKELAHRAKHSNKLFEAIDVVKNELGQQAANIQLIENIMHIASQHAQTITDPISYRIAKEKREHLHKFVVDYVNQATGGREFLQTLLDLDCELSPRDTLDVQTIESHVKTIDSQLEAYRAKITGTLADVDRLLAKYESQP